MPTIPVEYPIKSQILESDVIQPGQGEPVEFKEDAALSLVVNDADRAEAWVSDKQWSLWWREVDVLYQSPRKVATFEGTTVTRSNVSRFKIAQHIWSILPNLIRGLFYMDPPFELRPRPGTSQDTVRAKKAVFSSLLDQIGFRQEIMRGLFSMLLFGTGIWKYGWLSDSKTKHKYVRKHSAPRVVLPLLGTRSVPTDGSDDFKLVTYQEEVERPFFEAVDIRHVLVDPGCRVGDIRKAKYVIHKMYLTLEDLQRLRKSEGYDIPEDDVLEPWFYGPGPEETVGVGPLESFGQGIAGIQHAARRDEETTLDPAQRTLEVLERWDNDRVITVLNRKLTIRNEENPVGQIPFLSSNFFLIPDAFWGIGIGHIVGQEQRVEQGVVNAALDMLSFTLNPQYVRSRGANVPTQPIRQRLGGIIDADGDITKAFALLETPRVPPEAWTAIQQSQAAGEAASGANELLVQGSMPSTGRTSMGRTATGAGNMASASATRMDGPLTMFIDQVFDPWIEIMDQLVNQNMPVKILRKIVGEEIDSSDFVFDPSDYLNANLKYEILAGAHLSAKRAMAQSIPLIIQVLENQELLSQLQQTGKTVDVAELFKMLMEVSEWRNAQTLIRQLTPEEQQSMQQQNPAMQQLQGKMALNKQQAGFKEAQLDQETMGRAAREVLRQVFEKQSEPFETTGEPSPEYNG